MDDRSLLLSQALKASATNNHVLRLHLVTEQKASGGCSFCPYCLQNLKLRPVRVKVKHFSLKRESGRKKSVIVSSCPKCRKAVARSDVAPKAQKSALLPSEDKRSSVSTRLNEGSSKKKKKKKRNKDQDAGLIIPEEVRAKRIARALAAGDSRLVRAVRASEQNKNQAAPLLNFLSLA
jgi:hypothetical protein